MGRGRGACGGNAAGAGRMNDAAVGDMGAVAQLEPESARKPPADVPASGSNGAPYDDAAIQFCEAPQQTDQPPRCYGARRVTTRLCRGALSAGTTKKRSCMSERRPPSGAGMFY